MHESFQKSTARLRGGAALALAFLLCLSPLTVGAMAATVNQEETATKYLVPVGHTVGIKLFARGILVVQLSDGDSPAKRCGIRQGDSILSVNGQTVDSTETFQQLVKVAGGKEITLGLRRDGKDLTVKATPEQTEDGSWRLGAWVRDSMAGIGTMTFYDPESKVFGALGHGVTDMDTARLMPFASGAIIGSSVKAVKKGQQGAAGELRGDFNLSKDIGTLTTNCESGVFGVMSDGGEAVPLGAAVPVAEREEIKTGKATILANVSGSTVEEYDVEITRILSQTGSRNLLLTITDPKLLELTGGIVQGMSGSPILQEGKLVGAVTHVLVNDPTCGYGILVENMMEAAGIGTELAS